MSSYDNRFLDYGKDLGEAKVFNNLFSWFTSKQLYTNNSK